MERLRENRGQRRGQKTRCGHTMCHDFVVVVEGGCGHSPFDEMPPSFCLTYIYSLKSGELA